VERLSVIDSVGVPVYRDVVSRQPSHSVIRSVGRYKRIRDQLRPFHTLRYPREAAIA
jgi:hypothetical protein